MGIFSEVSVKYFLKLRSNVRLGENVKEKVDLYGALFVACLYVTNLWVQT